MTYQATAGSGDYGTMANLLGQQLVDGVLGAGQKAAITLPSVILTRQPEHQQYLVRLGHP